MTHRVTFGGASVFEKSCAKQTDRQTAVKIISPRRLTTSIEVNLC